MAGYAPRALEHSVRPRRLSGASARPLNFAVIAVTVNQPAPPWLLEPQWFFPFFALFWFTVTALLAILSGWRSLATYFRTEAPVEGEQFRFVSGSMGARFFPVSYRNCLFVTVNETGFGLSILALLRLLSPPLFIPWEAVASVESSGSCSFLTPWLSFENSGRGSLLGEVPADRSSMHICDCTGF